MTLPNGRCSACEPSVNKGRITIEEATSQIPPTSKVYDGVKACTLEACVDNYTRCEFTASGEVWIWSPTAGSWGSVKTPGTFVKGCVLILHISVLATAASLYTPGQYVAMFSIPDPDLYPE